MGRLGKSTTCSGLAWDEMLVLLHNLKKDGRLKMYLFICCGSYFGLRAGDLLRLKWQDVIDRDDFYVAEKKTGKTRKITVNASVKEALEFVKARLMLRKKYQPGGFLFANKWGGALSLSYVNKEFHKIVIRYNINTSNPSSHLCRKTFGRRVWSQDNHSERSLIYLSEIFGHASVATTRRYLGITQAQIADVYMKL